ncbi:MAG: NYN domain-containing protein [Elusimicrobia bacterium]|nr:NYN domain-containing protein [Candidatus Liberimonas magnetica]
MSIAYILDGYNIIKSDNTGKLNTGSLEQQRNSLIEFITKARPQGSLNNKITIVFDGLSSNEDAFWGGNYNKSVINGITVIFSLVENADRLIERTVSEHKNTSNIVVVTDDKGIRHNLGRTNARFMSTADFCNKLFKKNINNYQAKSQAELDNMDKINEEFKKKWL